MKSSPQGSGVHWGIKPKLKERIGVADGVQQLPQKSHVGPVPQEVILLETGPAVEGSVTDVLTEVGDLGTGLVMGECCMNMKMTHTAWDRGLRRTEPSQPLTGIRSPNTLISGFSPLDLWDDGFLLSHFVVVILTKLKRWFCRETMHGLVWT